MRGYRIIRAERLDRVLRANGRHTTQHLAIVAAKRVLEAELRLAAQENAALLLENQALLDQRPRTVLLAANRDPLPHDAYMVATATALQIANLDPTNWDVLEAGPGEDLEAYFRFASNHPAVDGERWPDGMTVLWSASGGWEWHEMPGDTLIALRIDRYAKPLALAQVLRQLLAGREPRADITLWSKADATAAAVQEWIAMGGVS